MKKLKVFLIVTCCIFVIWLAEMIVYAAFHPRSKADDLPQWLVLQVFTLACIWFVIGIILLVMHFKTVRAGVLKFINEK